MTGSTPRLAGMLGGTHTDVLGARLRRGIVTAAGVLVTLAGSLAIAVAVKEPSLTLTLAVVAGGAAVIALVLDPRLEVTVTVLVLYLGLLDGPVKLLSGAHETATVFRDVLIAAVSIGAFLRLLVSRRPIVLPPLSGWVLLFVALVVAEALNPKTAGLTKALGGFRQQLEFVPFFFFGYALMRSKQRLRALFLILGVLALANGIVSTYQTKLSPAGLASWGPGYKELVLPPSEGGGVTARAYVAGGTTHVRPPGLGKDAGFGGSVGLMALPGLLALLATWRRRWRWIPMALALGALLALITGLGRLQVVAAVMAVLAFAVMAATAGRRVTRVLTTILAVAAVAVPAGVALVAIESPGTFSRYSEIAPANAASAKDKKTGELEHLPTQLEEAPFGVGLATAGAASGFGGKLTNILNGHGVGAETQYNFIGDELGVPGVLLWIGLAVEVVLLALFRLRNIEDVEVRVLLAGVFSVLVAFLLAGISGPITSNAGGAYFWFAVGVAAYWIAGRVPARAPSVPQPRARPAPVTA